MQRINLSNVLLEFKQVKLRKDLMSYIVVCVTEIYIKIFDSQLFHLLNLLQVKCNSLMQLHRISIYSDQQTVWAVLAESYLS